MPLIPLSLPPGVYRNGTPYQAANRYYDSQLVRWHDGSLRPIGGWKCREIMAPDCSPTLVCDFAGNSYASDDISLTGIPPTPVDGCFSPISNPTKEVIRDIYAWSDNSGFTQTVFGSNLSLYYSDPDRNIFNITPLIFTGGIVDPSEALGFGYCPFGQFPFGGGCGGTTVNLPAVDMWRWCFDTWGQDLLATGWLNRGPIYAWSLSDLNAEPVPNAPDDVWGLVVTDQRMVMTIGSKDDPRMVRWSNRENREEWTPTTENTAGFFKLQGYGKLLSIHKVLNQVLILSETDAHVASFVGSPYVYRFDRVGDNCGPVHPAAIVTTDRFAMWLGSRTFWLYDGTLRQAPCEVMDYIQETADPAMWSKMVGFTVSDYSEIWWMFQSKDGTEVDTYVMFNYLTSAWAIGKLERTAAIDARPLENVVMVDKAGVIYDHELRDVAVTGAYAETGPLELANGDPNLAIRYLFPDAEVAGTVQVTIYGKQAASGGVVENVYGPYPYNNPTPTRAMGRQLRLRFTGLPQPGVPDWEVGTFRMDIAKVGTGMR